MKKSLVRVAVFATLTSGLSLFGAVGVSDVKVQQRWPFNGMVDIDYTVTSDSADDDVFVYPTALETDRNIAIAPRTLTGDGVTAGFTGACVKPGTHRMTWNMPADEPNLHSSAFKVTIAVRATRRSRSTGRRSTAARNTGATTRSSRGRSAGRERRKGRNSSRFRSLRTARWKIQNPSPCESSRPAA